MRIVTLLCFFTMPLLAADYRKFPDWASQHLNAHAPAGAPEDAAIWRIFDETQITWRADGKVKLRRRIVQYVLRERGASNASMFRIDGDEETTRIKKLKGWHLRPNQQFEKLDRANWVTMGTSTSDQISTDTQTLAFFENVSRGSVIVFESSEVHKSYFPIEILSLTTTFPIRERVIGIQGEGGTGSFTILPLSLENWGLKFEKTASSLTVHDIPGLENEPLSPDFPDPYPMVYIVFQADKDAAKLASWDSLATWFYRMFHQRAGTATATSAVSDKAVIEKEVAFFNDQISYRQRYMTAARGWEPAPGETVLRRAYGDCKDMSACVAFRLGGEGFRVLPALANIGDGRHTGPDTPPGPYFNHVIDAIPLETSLGLPAEVDVKGVPHLLYDPTSKFTSVGYLPGQFRNRRLLVCSEQGGTWVTVPDTAIEKEAVTVTLRGRLDRDFTFNGQIELEEKGDVYGFRTLSKTGNPLDLAWQLKWRFDIPGVVDITQKDVEIDDSGTLTLVYEVSWPSFFKRDIDGLRLPESISGRQKRRLVTGLKKRHHPISFNSRPETTWNLKISSTVALDPGLAAAQHSDDFNQFEWTAEGGTVINVNYKQSRKEAYWGRDQLEEGQAYWDSYREAYNAFRLNGTLFHVQ